MRDPSDDRDLSPEEAVRVGKALNTNAVANKMQPGQMSPWMEAVLSGRIDPRDSPRAIAAKIGQSGKGKGKSPKNGTETDKLLATIQKMNKQTEIYGGKSHKEPGRSTFHKILDVLSAPGNAITSAIYEGNQENDFIHEVGGVLHGLGAGLKSGITGKGAHHVSDIREQEDWDFGRIGNAAFDFVGSVALDPTMYVGLGAITRGAKGAAEAAHADETERAVAPLLEGLPDVVNRSPGVRLSEDVTGSAKKAAPRKRVSAATSKRPGMISVDVTAERAAGRAEGAAHHVKTEPGKYAHLSDDFFENGIYDVLPESLQMKFSQNVEKAVKHATGGHVADASPAIIRGANEHVLDAVIKHLRATANTPTAKKILDKLERKTKPPVAKGAKLPAHQPYKGAGLISESEMRARNATRIAAERAAETVTTATEKQAVSHAAAVAAEDLGKVVKAEKGDDIRAVSHKQKIDDFDAHPEITDEATEATLNVIREGFKGRNGKRNHDYNMAKQVNAYNRIRDAIIEHRAPVEITGKARDKSAVFRKRLADHPDGSDAARIDGLALAALKELEDRVISAGHSPIHFDGTPVRLSDVLANLEQGISHKLDYLTQLRSSVKGLYTSPRLAEAVAMAAEAGKLDEGAKLSGAIRGISEAVQSAAPDTADVAATVRNTLATGKAAKQAAKEMGASPAGQKAAAATLAEHGDELLDPVAKTLDETAARVPEVATSGAGKPPKATIAAVADGTIKRAEATERYLGIVVGFGARHRWAEIPLVKLGENPRRIILASKVATATVDARKAGAPGSSAYEAVIKTQLSRIERTEDFLRTRFQSAYGVNTTIHGRVTGAEGGARSLAHNRARMLNDMAVAFGRDNVNDAIRVAAKGGSRPAVSKATGAELDLGKFFENYMANMFGKGSVTGREVLTKNELNAELERLFHTDKYNFKGEGEEWRESWRQIFDDPSVKNPIQLIPAFEQATQAVILRNHVFEHVAGLWGIKAGENIPAGYRTLTTNAIDGLKRDGMYFPEDIAQQLDRSFAAATQDIKAPNALIRKLDDIMGYWKAGVTIYNPAFHIRNMEGDIFMGWLDGVRSQSYYKASRVLKVGKQQRGEFLSEFTGNMAENAPRTGTIKLKRAIEYRGKKVTELPHEAVYDLYLQHGLRQEISVAEQLRHGRDPLDMTDANAAQRASGAIRNASEYREDLGRMAHFIDRMERSKAGSLDEMAAEAAHYTRKFHFDYNDLTEFEKKIMRRIVPFYTWQRKSIPLLMEQTLMQPGRMNIYPKAAQMVSQALGFDVNQDNPFPAADAIMPAWMQATAMFPVHQNENGNFVYAEPATPFNDMWTKTLGGPATENPLNSLYTNTMASVNPALRIPFELTRGKQYFGNTPISDKTNYTTSQIPIVSTVGRLLNVDPVGTVVGQGDPIARNKKNFGQYEDETSLNTPALINFLTALGLNENTERKRRSELRRQQDVVEIDRKKAKTDFWRKTFGYDPPKGK